MKQILIVGGGGGLGSALVRDLLDHSYEVVVAGRTKPAEERIRQFYLIDATRVDWRSLYMTIEKETGAPTAAVVFVAGTAVFGRTALIPLERARQTFELNFWACTTAARAAAEYWNDKSRAGKFLAILSIAGRRAVPFEAYYCASKAAAARFLECLQLEYAHKNIEFVCAFPGLLKTPFRRHAEWCGLEPAFADEGADVDKTARAVIELLEGKRKTRVIGWRERSIDFADRLWPGLYDRAVLLNRVAKLLK
jgi:NAD(P)-dependent dehydrogenase (short-subunit alcohol dehydrogenase family)